MSDYKTLLSKVLYHRHEIDDSDPIYLPFIRTINDINIIINNKITEIENIIEYRDKVTKITGHPFFHWIIREEQFDKPSKIQTVDLNRQLLAITTGKIQYSHLYAPCDHKPIIKIISNNWIIFGCSQSTDVDIMIIADEKTFEEEYDTSIIMDKYGKDCDINVGLLKDGYISQVKRGIPSLSNNCIMATYHLHKQEHPLLVTHSVELDIENMIHSCIMYILNNREHLMPNYIEVKKNKEVMAQMYNDKIKAAITLLRNITSSYDPDQRSNAEWLDCMKSIIMKILQIYLYNRFGQEAYDKRKLAEITAVHDSRLSLEGLLWHLFRGTRGVYSADILNVLTNEFEEICNSMINFNWHPFPLRMTNPISELDSKVFEAFIKSPSICTKDFIQKFTDIYKSSFGSLFISKSSPMEKFPLWLRPYIEDVDQRSDSWKKLLLYYSCGGKTNTLIQSKKNEPFCETYYNLFRGCLVEAIVCNSNMWTFQKLYTGMLVKEKKEGAIAVSPDLLLLNGEDIIFPLEIKCITGAKNSADYFRAVYLAKKQLKRALDLLENAYKYPIVRQAFLILVYATDELHAECVWLNL